MASHGPEGSGAWGEIRAGWRTLLGATLGVAVGSASLPFYTAGVFIPSLEGAFGWSRNQFATLSLVATLGVVLCAPLAGQAVDRFGVRLPAAASMTAVAVCFAGLGMTNSSFISFSLLQIALYAFGVASTPISFTRAINERFSTARGVALGITLSGTGIAATFAPIAMAHAVADYGWRTAYWILAAVVAISIPAVLLLLAPSKSVRVERAAATAEAATEPGAAVQPITAYLRNPRFIRLMATFFFLALGVAGFVLHFVPMLTDQGMSQIDAAAVQARLGVAVIAGRLVIGVLVDHFFAPRVAALSLCATVAGIAALALVGTSVAPWSAFAIGFALGAEVDLIGYLTARYFGMSAYGRLYAVLYGSFVLGTGLSPLLIAQVAQRFGGYQPALWCCAAFVTIAVILLATSPRFPPGDDAATSH